jgi:hypothetical protein
VQQLLRRAAAQLPCSRRALCYAMKCCVLTYFTASTLLSGSRPFKLSRLGLMTCVLVNCWWEQPRCTQQSFCNACLQRACNSNPKLALRCAGTNAFRCMCDDCVGRAGVLCPNAPRRLSQRGLLHLVQPARGLPEFAQTCSVTQRVNSGRQPTVHARIATEQACHGSMQNTVARTMAQCTLLVNTGKVPH